MARLIKARVSQGKLDPLEDLDLEEGTEVVVSVAPNGDFAERLERLRAYGAKRAKEAGITSEEQVNEIVHE